MIIENLAGIKKLRESRSKLNDFIPGEKQGPGHLTHCRQELAFPPSL